MATQTKKNTSKNASIITKSISLPDDMVEQADPKIISQHEGNWSRYVRSLIRKDLETAQPAAA